MNNKIQLSFSAIDKYITQPLETSIETEVKGTEYIKWGETNHYPQQLYALYENVPTLHSAIESCVNYILGDEIETDFNKPNADDTWNDLIRYIAFDYILYGAFAINVLRNSLGMVVAYHYVDVKNLRSDKKNENFWYSEDWNKSYGRVKTIKYPKFEYNSVAASSILYYKNTKCNTYGVPFWGAAINACEAERRINEYNLNQLVNGFSASYIVNLNNGTPSDEQMEEIEQNFEEKFNGTENAGRLVIAYNNDKEHAATIEAIPENKNVEKYLEVVKRSREQILSVFRMHPSLLGIQAENTGWNDSDIKESFALANKTVIKPIQDKLVEKINDFVPNLNLAIKPFSISFEDVQNNNVIEDEQ